MIWKLLLSPCVRLTRLLVIVVAWRSFSLVFDVKFAGLLKDPTISIGMICRFIGGAMNLARPIEYSVQTRWTIFVSFEWLLPLTGFRATESGVDRRVFGIFIVALTLVFVASWPAVAISGFGGVGVAVAVASMS